MAACSAPCSADTAMGMLRALCEVPVGFARVGVTSRGENFCRCQALEEKANMLWLWGQALEVFGARILSERP